MNTAPDSPEAREFGALVLAGIGDTKRAESLMQLQKRFPYHTMVQSYWLPTIRAQIAIVKQQPQQAIDVLQRAVPVELGKSLSTQGPPCMYPIYVRGEAYLAARLGSAAAAKFEKFIDHRGITWSCAAYALAGDKTKADAAYQNFFALGKTPTPTFPSLRASNKTLFLVNQVSNTRC